MTMPPRAGDRTTCGVQIPNLRGNLGAAGLSFAGMLQDQGALQVAWTVQSGGQSKVTFQQGTHPPEPLENGINSDGRHSRRVYLLHGQNICGVRSRSS